MNNIQNGHSRSNNNCVLLKTAQITMTGNSKETFSPNKCKFSGLIKKRKRSFV